MSSQVLSQDKVLVEQTLAATMLRVPNRVQRARDGAAVEWTDGPDCFRLKPYAPECLQQFLTLAGRNPADGATRAKKKPVDLCQQVLAFTREWGPIVKPDEEKVSSTGGLTFTREITWVQGAAITTESLALVEEEAEAEHKRQEKRRSEIAAQVKGQPTIYTEPLAAWSDLANDMAAMIGLVDYLRVPSAERKASRQAEAHRQWDRLVGKQSPPSKFPLQDAEGREAIIKHTVSLIASDYLKSVGAVPVVAWGSDFPRVKLYTPDKRASSLYAALVLHFVTVICNPKGTFVCAVCKLPTFKLDEENTPRAGAICADSGCASQQIRDKVQRCRDKKKQQAIIRPAAS